jgi:hypothetical protein
MIKILQMNECQPLGPAIKKPIAEKPFTPEQVRPGVFKGADGKLYTDFKANETPAVFHPPKQQVPTPLPTLPVVPNALADGWIDCHPDMPDLPAGTYEQRSKGCDDATLVREYSAHKNFMPYAWPNYQYRPIPKAEA